METPLLSMTDILVFFLTFAAFYTSLLIKTINYIILFEMNTDYCQHLTRYRLSDIMRIPICLLAFIFAGNGIATAQVSPFVEYGATVHTGDNTPLWQVSNQQGLGSIYDNTYVRGGVGYKHKLGKWKFEEKLDMVAAAGMNFKGDKDIFIQQAYIDVRYKWLGLFAGSRKRRSIAEQCLKQRRYDMVGQCETHSPNNGRYPRIPLHTSATCHKR